ncbi:MAG TPA: hypothetical protein VN634_10210 [Candidatus Limnocylindrales bacterium]|nr:hypothetical protein [Candidatus Limnocylindrales bacterium]
MDRLVQGRPGVMHVVLKRRVDPPVMSVRPAALEAPVQVDAVGIEERAVCKEQDVHVHRHEHRQEQQRRRANELVDVIVGDHRKRRRIEEHVVALVLLPPEAGHMAEAVVGEFVEVGSYPHDKEREREIACAVAAEPRVRLRPSRIDEVQRDRRAQRCRVDALEHLKHFAPHHRWPGIDRIRLSLPRLERRPIVIAGKQRARHDHHQHEGEGGKREPGRQEVAVLCNCQKHSGSLPAEHNAPAIRGKPETAGLPRSRESVGLIRRTGLWESAMQSCVRSTLRIASPIRKKLHVFGEP